MKNKKLFKIILISVTAVISVLSVFFGVFFGNMSVNPEAFEEQINSGGVYLNDTGSKIPQTAIYRLIYNHFFENESCKTPKLLFIGYDGCVANAVTLMKDYEESAIFRISETGGLYLSYAGGEKEGDQDTSTAPGWASIFTGQWASSHGVYDNKYTLSENSKSIVYLLGESGFKTSYTTLWEPHITVTYKNEVAAAKAKGLALDYILTKENSELRNEMRAKILGDGDAIFGIFEETDHAGHGSGFTVKNKKYVEGLREAESYADSLLNAVESRASYLTEDWLVVIASDHGGRFMSHGGISPMERTTFFAVNKPFTID